MFIDSSLNIDCKIRHCLWHLCSPKCLFFTASKSHKVITKSFLSLESCQEKGKQLTMRLTSYSIDFCLSLMLFQWITVIFLTKARWKKSVFIWQCLGYYLAKVNISWLSWHYIFVADLWTAVLCFYIFFGVVFFFFQPNIMAYDKRMPKRLTEGVSHFEGVDGGWLPSNTSDGMLPKSIFHMSI